MTSHRPTICGTRHALSAGHYLATMAGSAILEAGGNAIDAGARPASRSACCSLHPFAPSWWWHGHHNRSRVHRRR